MSGEVHCVRLRDQVVTKNSSGVSRFGVSRQGLVVVACRRPGSNPSRQVGAWSPNDTQKIGSISSR
jgi:hypothetical protein